MVAQELLGFLAGGLGGVILFNAIKMFRESQRRDAYESATARVLDSHLETHSIGQGSTSTKYSPKIRYEYTVEGETYTNDNLYPGPATSGSSNKDEQQEILRKYPEGESVEVYYDPNEPPVSFLENESRNRQAVVTGILGGALLLFGLGMIVGISV